MRFLPRRITPMAPRGPRESRATLLVFWLLVDRKPKTDVRERGDEQYYILYEQSYRNENPHHLFDENKPAWIDHTTIPHTLAAAMINITRPWWKPKSNASSRILCDPFVGTGTTLLEALKLGLEGVCGDREALSRHMVDHNLQFFSLRDAELRDLTAAIWHVALGLFGRPDKAESTAVAADRAHAIREYGDLFDAEFCDSVGTDFEKSYKLYLALKHEPSGEISIPAAVISAIAKAELRQALFFYIALRTHHRRLTGIGRQDPRRLRFSWNEAFGAEAAELARKMDELRKLVQRRQVLIRDPVRRDLLHVEVFPGKYSRSCGIASTAIYSRALRSGSLDARVRCQHALKLPA